MQLTSKNNHLILGSSSNIASEYICLNGKHNNNYYGISTKPHVNKNSQLFEQVLGFDKVKYFSNIKFSKIFIISSRNPSQGGSLNQFIKVNDMIESVLDKISYSHSHKPQIIFLSSFSVYDKKSDYISDTTETSPSDYYGESKLLLEKQLIDFSIKNNVDLLILRLPVFLYQGVGFSSSNFLAKLSLAIKYRQRFKLSNPKSYLGAVFDMPTLIKLASKKLPQTNIVNCASMPDITFTEIAEEAIKYGLEGIDWQDSDRGSVKVCLKTIENVIGFKPSSKDIIKNWMAKEFKS